MNNVIAIIDRAFFSWDKRDNSLTITKPGHMQGDTYYPAESVTLLGVNVPEELLAFVREIKTQQVEESKNDIKPAKPQATTRTIPEPVLPTTPEDSTPYPSLEFIDIQDVSSHSGRELPENL